MDIRHALKEQYHASLAMLADCVERCPDDMWSSETEPRTFWRIAMHAAFFAYFYLIQDEVAFQSWPDGRPEYRAILEPWKEGEPDELPEGVSPMTRTEVIAYIAFVDGLVDSTVDRLDLNATETGFSWYKNMSKLSHELMNLRHIQGHVGQLSELLMGRGIDTDWVGKATSYARG